jgi:hypothetical protein
VLLYRGTGVSDWGISGLLTFVRLPGLRDVLAGQASLLVLLAAASAPFLLILGPRATERGVQGLGLTLACFLALSPAFGMQYVSWGLAASYLFAPRLAHVFNFVASVFVLKVYSHWNMGPPWRWDRGFALPLDSAEKVLMFLTWLTLVGIIAAGLFRTTRIERSTPSTDEGEVHHHADL